MKTILITGISKGIGKALANKLLNEGYSVIGTSTTGAADFEHKNLRVLQLELTDPVSIAKCAKEAGRVDILMNNAGALLDDGISELIVENLRKTLEVNLIGTADFTEQVLPNINPEGRVAFTSSTAGSISEADYKTHSHHPNQYPAYKISKAALNMYMRTLAMRLEHDERRITVASIHPGWVRTDMGGEDAPVSPQEAAEQMFATLTQDNLETGQFWFNGEKYPW